MANGSSSKREVTSRAHGEGEEETVRHGKWAKKGFGGGGWEAMNT